MKKLILMGMLTLITAISYSQCPVGAKRNNGNGNSCVGWLELIFAESPSVVSIDSMYVNGVKETNPVYMGRQDHGQTFQLIYCLDKNYPPVSHFQIWYAGADPTKPCDIITGGPLAVKIKSFNARAINKNEIKVTIVAEDSEGEVIKVRLSYDEGKTWVDRALFIPAGAGTFTLTIKR